MHHPSQRGLSLLQEAKLVQLEKHCHQLRGTLSRDLVKALQHICSHAAGRVNLTQLQL